MKKTIQILMFMVLPLLAISQTNSNFIPQGGSPGIGNVTPVSGTQYVYQCNYNGTGLLLDIDIFSGILEIQVEDGSVYTFTGINNSVFIPNPFITPEIGLIGFRWTGTENCSTVVEILATNDTFVSNWDLGSCCDANFVSTASINNQVIQVSGNATIYHETSNVSIGAANICLESGFEVPIGSTFGTATGCQ